MECSRSQRTNGSDGGTCFSQIGGLDKGLGDDIDHNRQHSLEFQLHGDSTLRRAYPDYGANFGVSRLGSRAIQLCLWEAVAVFAIECDLLGRAVHESEELCDG